MNLILAVLIATAQQVQLPPAPRGYGTSTAEVVVDAAGVLDPATIDRLNRIAFEMRAKTGGEMAIVTLPDLRGRDVAEVALRIGREWGVGGAAGVGDRTRNAGIVVLLVPKETASDGQGRIRIETGRGVEGFIPDGVAGEIQRSATPRFRERDYGAGLLIIAEGIADRFAREFGVTLDTALVPAPMARSPSTIPFSKGPSFGAVLFLLFVVLLILSGASRSRRRRGRGPGGCLSPGFGDLLWLLSVLNSQGRGRRGGWGGGGFGGGSFGGGGGFGGFGGGGGFSGGGSSGSW